MVNNSNKVFLLKTRSLHQINFTIDKRWAARVWQNNSLNIDINLKNKCWHTHSLYTLQEWKNIKSSNLSTPSFTIEVLYESAILHSKRPKLYTILVFLNTIWLIQNQLYLIVMKVQEKKFSKLNRWICKIMALFLVRAPMS